MLAKHNTLKQVPYIGVTDFTSPSQVIEALSHIPYTLERRLHVGVMMSYKTLRGIKTSTGWEHIWPRGKALQAIFQSFPQVFNVLHYADYEQPSHTSFLDIKNACMETGPYLHGLQLDMLWPEPFLLEKVKEWRPDLEIILQVGKHAVSMMHESDGSLDTWLRPYIPFTSYYLIDYSMGRGLPMDVSFILECVKEMADLVTPNHITVAGGLGPDTVHLLEEIFKYSSLISCDAQGQMRLSGNAKDPIDMSRVCKYVHGVSSLLKSRAYA